MISSPLHPTSLDFVDLLNWNIKQSVWILIREVEFVVVELVGFNCPKDIFVPSFILSQSFFNQAH